MMIGTFKTEGEFVSVRDAGQARTGREQSAQCWCRFGCLRMGAAPVGIARTGTASGDIEKVLYGEGKAGQRALRYAGYVHCRINKRPATRKNGIVGVHAPLVQD